MAALEATFDLRSSSSPRSLCVFPAATPPMASLSTGSKGRGNNDGGTNPFDVASAPPQPQTPMCALVFGTERGALHYRTYATPSSNASMMRSTSSTSPQPQGFGGISSSSGRMVQQPLGWAGAKGSSGISSGVHPLHMPVDLNGAVPGAVVHIVRAAHHNTVQPVFLLLVDDNRGTSNAGVGSGAYASHLVTLRHGAFAKLPPQGSYNTPSTSSSSAAAASGAAASSSLGPLPRMTCAAHHPRAGFVYAAGTSVYSLAPPAMLAVASALDSSSSSSGSSSSSSNSSRPLVLFRSQGALPAPGVRSGQDALVICCEGRVAVAAVSNSFYAVPSIPMPADHLTSFSSTERPISNSSHKPATKILSFTQSSQVHPVICLEVTLPTTNGNNDHSSSSSSSSMMASSNGASTTSLLFLASGRECAIVEVVHDVRHLVTSSPPRHGIATVTSPILAATHCGGKVAVLTSDGLVQTRSPSCIAIPLSTVEVGARPNDFFILQSLHQRYQQEQKQHQNLSHPKRRMISISYSGEGRQLIHRLDTPQDLADRLMKLSIDAFGASGFPRSQLAESVGASFSATSYVGAEPTAHTRSLLRQYLEAVLGLSDDFGGDNMTLWGKREGDVEDDELSGDQSFSPSTLVAGTALLCLACSQLTPPNSTLANRAARSCSSKVGVISPNQGDLHAAAVSLCELVADKLLGEAATNFSLVGHGAISSIHRASPAGISMEFVEASVWLLRSCGKHEKAIQVLHDRVNNPSNRNKAASVTSGREGSSSGLSSNTGFWSQIKYESFTAAHLGELWASMDEHCCGLVLKSSATKKLLENNPRLGLSVFTASHPQNQQQWMDMVANEDPCFHPFYPAKVVKLLKSVNPSVPYDSMTELSGDGSPRSFSRRVEDGIKPLPLLSGRALAATFLESVVGISTNRPMERKNDAFSTLPPDEATEERSANMHDELAYLLLEGVITERGDDEADVDTELGSLYRGKLRRFLCWHNAKVRSERLLASLPSSFLQEHALLLGRLGRHEEALRILYCDLQSLDLALEYCDARYEREEARFEQEKANRNQYDKTNNNIMNARNDLQERHGESVRCAYLPLVRVALESDSDTERGTAAAIQVLALRRGAIDRGSALRLLPQNVPVSAVARPFLIPALVDSESQVRRLKVAAALLRAKYIDLKRSLTDAQIKAQASLHAVPALRTLNLGEPLHSSKPYRARPAHAESASPTLPEVTIIKHFFPRHLVIQAKVTNSAPGLNGRTLGNVSFVVAESSDEAIMPSAQVPVKALPPKSTGSAWCALAAAPQRLDGTAILTCELRYSVLAVDTTTGAPLSFGGGTMATSGLGRAYVEELQDMEIHAAHFAM